VVELLLGAIVGWVLVLTRGPFRGAKPLAMSGVEPFLRMREEGDRHSRVRWVEITRRVSWSRSGRDWANIAVANMSGRCQHFLGRLARALRERHAALVEGFCI